MTDPDKCIICLEPLPPPPLEHSIDGVEGDDGGGGGGGGGIPNDGAGSIGDPVEAAATTAALDEDDDNDDDNDGSGSVAAKSSASSQSEEDTEKKSNSLTHVAKLEGCDHLLHDSCIRAWAEQTNTCPVCRTGFNAVNVYNGVNGPHLSSYPVADKKQVADFDIREWLDQTDGVDEEEDTTPCPICGLADQEECLLLCDSCDAAYHTHCIGLSHVPEGHWYCMECDDGFQAEDSEGGVDEDTEQDGYSPALIRNRASSSRRATSRIFPRTRGRLRRVRQNARALDWVGREWGEITRSVYVGLDLDLDNPDGDDNFNHYRRSQQRTNRERREYLRWQQRLDIASSLGAREAFSSAIPRGISALLHSPPPASPQRTSQQEADDRNERRAWLALERAREDASHDTRNPGHRKRKSRSLTASPRESAMEPERKLKRPRTRRLPTQGELSVPVGFGSGHGSGSGTGSAQGLAGTGFSPRPLASSPARFDDASSPVAAGTQSPSAVETPSFLTSLLKEVEMGTPSDDESVKILFGNRRVPDASSPASASPSPSAHNSPRALSATPPPAAGGRPNSPPLLLSSHIEPRYLPANYSPNQSPNQSPSQSPVQAMTIGSSSEASDGEGTTTKVTVHRPRPQRVNGAGAGAGPRPDDYSHNGTGLSLEDKNSINGIVRVVLRPYWRAKKLSSEQYAIINRNVSRRLYDEAREMSVMDEDARKVWEKLAAQEVAKAMADIKV